MPHRGAHQFGGAFVHQGTRLTFDWPDHQRSIETQEADWSTGAIPSPPTLVAKIRKYHDSGLPTVLLEKLEA